MTDDPLVISDRFLIKRLFMCNDMVSVGQSREKKYLTKIFGCRIRFVWLHYTDSQNIMSTFISFLLLLYITFHYTMILTSLTKHWSLKVWRTVKLDTWNDDNYLCLPAVMRPGPGSECHWVSAEESWHQPPVVYHGHSSQQQPRHTPCTLYADIYTTHPVHRSGTIYSRQLYTRV